MLADILYGLLLLVSVLVTVRIFQYIRMLRYTSNMPSEYLFVLMFFLLAITLLGYILLSQQISKSQMPDSKQIQTKKDAFIEQLYPPLSITQKRLNNQIKGLVRLKQNIVTLRDQHPQQKERLELTYFVWSRERKSLIVLKNEMDRAINKAWSYYNSVDKSTVENNFSDEAIDWNKAIKSRLDEYQRSQSQVTNIMLDNVTRQRKSLSEIVIGMNEEVQIADRLLQNAFSGYTINVLLKALKIKSAQDAALLDVMNQEINIAAQKRQEVRNYALDKPVLRAKLRRVIEDWLMLESRAMYYRNKVLYAIQASYLAQLLGVNQQDNQIVRLEREINKKLPILLEKLRTSVKRLEKKYHFLSHL